MFSGSKYGAQRCSVDGDSIVELLCGDAVLLVEIDGEFDESLDVVNVNAGFRVEAAEFGMFDITIDDGVVLIANLLSSLDEFHKLLVHGALLGIAGILHILKEADGAQDEGLSVQLNEGILIGARTRSVGGLDVEGDVSFLIDDEPVGLLEGPSEALFVVDVDGVRTRSLASKRSPGRSSKQPTSVASELSSKMAAICSWSSW